MCISVHSAIVSVACAKSVQQIALLVAHCDQHVCCKRQGQQKVTEAHARRSPHTQENADVHRMPPPPVEQPRLQARCMQPTTTPRSRLLDAEQLTHAEGPCAEKENDPTGGEQGPENVLSRGVLDVPELGGDGLPEQDQDEKRQIGRCT